MWVKTERRWRFNLNATSGAYACSLYASRISGCVIDPLTSNVPLMLEIAYTVYTYIHYVPFYLFTTVLLHFIIILLHRLYLFNLKIISSGFCTH